MPNRSQFKTNEEYNAWLRAYRAKDPEKFRSYNREYNKLWRKKNGYHNEAKWKKSHPIAIRAERLLRYAVRLGKIKRLPCVICGKEKSVAHHPNYREALKVVFLCAKHHYEFHFRGKRSKTIIN